MGLDSDLMRIPPAMHKHTHPQFAFNKAVIDATHDLICAYKINSAFYEARGTDGILDMKKTFDYLKKTYPDTPVILDFKRGDIGSTNEGYIRFAYDYCNAAAVTLNPYVGRDALAPFFERSDKGCIILCRTSNLGADELQDVNVHAYDPGRVDASRVHKMTEGTKLYQVIAEKVANEWNTNGNCMLVVGATYPDELKVVRGIVGNMTILVPGIGVQGGDLEATLSAGLTEKKDGLIINSSRGIIFASGGKDFVETAREKTLTLRDAINVFR